MVVDLLKTDVFAEYAVRPSLLRERFEDFQGTIVLDEIQKVPALLDEVHWLIENRGLSFLMTGSSARKLRRGHANLLGGRAWRRTMVPLTTREVEGFDLISAMVSGMLPPHFLSSDPMEDLRAYQAYRDPEMLLTYWRTSTGQEVDFILGEKEMAVEVLPWRYFLDLLWSGSWRK